MNILALDTCFGAVSVAISWRSARGETLVREDYEEREIGHAERLIPMLDAVVDGAGIGFTGLNRIAVTLGPGSFTGLRIGIATARALSLAANIPVVGMTSLAVMAARADHLLGARREGRAIAVCVDARRGAVYFELFGENAGDTLVPAGLVTAAEAARLVGEREVVAVGSGAALVGASGSAGCIEVALPSLQPHARYLAILAPLLKPLDSVVPLYLRDADAKVQTGAALPRVAS